MEQGLTSELATAEDAPRARVETQPVVTIQPSHGWQFIDLGKVWRYRELALVLAARDIKVRYKQAVIGASWAILQPLTMILIFTWLFRALGTRPIAAGADYPYPVSVCCGLLPWLLFANGLKGASESLVLHQDMIKKIYFPRIILPAVPIVTALVDFVIATTLLAAMMLYYGIAPGWEVVTLPIFILLAVMTAFSLGLWFSALNALYRDLRHAVPFLIQIWFFVTPVIYEAEGLVSGKWQVLFALNPMVGVVEGFRWALLGSPQPPVLMMSVSFVSTAVLLVSGLFWFRRLERVFVDWI